MQVGVSQADNNKTVKGKSMCKAEQAAKATFGRSSGSMGQRRNGSRQQVARREHVMITTHIL